MKTGSKLMETRAPLESLSDAIYGVLRADIMQCRLRPGATIDTNELTERFNVSKTPLRDALKRLSIEGLVDILPRSGYRVKPITFRVIHEILDLRAALGPHAAFMAARYITPAELEELRAILGDYLPASGQGELQSAARRFHVAVARASRNARIAALTDSCFEELERVMRLTVDFSPRKDEDSRDHILLIDALTEGDGETAAEIERSHIAKARAFLLETLIVKGHFSDSEISDLGRTRAI
ncbi:MAG: transcriptional regulator, GntR family [Rhodobacteraceae bacterium HLUCCA12]|nr:MAG: transcriptional regulator, GntR family [Rhodobacteraceae bacterium HLUCCA12]